tara:strand:+ start:7995 stop:8441 length:447 start_codon:yes stop_codon:yes gene_type:complete
VPEEPCQCPDCRRFYKEHDRLIREFPTLRQQQELNWAALQAFRTLCGRVLEDLQKQYGKSHKSNDSNDGVVLDNQLEAINQSIADLDNVNAHLFSIEVLMERIFDAKVPEVVEKKFKELAGELAPDPLNIDRLRLNRLLHQTPDLPDR